MSERRCTLEEFFYLPGLGVFDLDPLRNTRNLQSENSR